MTWRKLYIIPRIRTPMIKPFKGALAMKAPCRGTYRKKATRPTAIRKKNILRRKRRGLVITYKLFWYFAFSFGNYRSVTLRSTRLRGFSVVLFPSARTSMRVLLTPFSIRKERIASALERDILRACEDVNDGPPA